MTYNFSILGTPRYTEIPEFCGESKRGRQKKIRSCRETVDDWIGVSAWREGLMTEDQCSIKGSGR